MGQLILSYIDPSPTQELTGTVSFNPGLARLVEPRYFPIQKVSIAESGQTWIFQLSSNVELELIVDLMDIPTEALTSPVETDGYTKLYTFLTTNVNWSQRAFTLTDPDGDSFSVRYIAGFDSLREAGGRTEKANRWSGSLTLRRVVT